MPSWDAEKLKIADLRASHILLQTLHCEHTGWKEYLQILIPMNHPLAEFSHLEESRRRLERIETWQAMLWDYDPVLRDDGSSVAVEERDLAMEMLDDLQARFLLVEYNLKNIAAVADLAKDKNASAYVLACLAWREYAFLDTVFVTGVVAEKFGDKSLIEEVHHEAPLAGARIHHVEDMRSQIRSPEKVDLRTAEHLQGELGRLPSDFRNKAYNVLILAQGIRKRISVLASKAG